MGSPQVQKGDLTEGSPPKVTSRRHTEYLLQARISKTNLSTGCLKMFIVVKLYAQKPIKCISSMSSSQVGRRKNTDARVLILREEASQYIKGLRETLQRDVPPPRSGSTGRKIAMDELGKRYPSVELQHKSSEGREADSTSLTQ